MVGSDDATTCCVITLRHQESGHVSVTHYDGNMEQSEAMQIVDELFDLIPKKKRSQSQLQCTLLGCYNDEKGHSETIVNEILRTDLG